MKSLICGAAALVLLAAGGAKAQTVDDSSLQNLNGSYGAGVAVTTTTASGTRTSVTGPGGGANRASGSLVSNQWYQANVGGNASVGITTDYARNGDGSVSFSTSGPDSKADLQYYFTAPVALSSLTSVSYDFFRSSTSAADPNLSPVFRFDIYKGTSFAGSLVLENVYQNQTPSPVDNWTTLSANLGSGIFWATNAALGPTFASANGGQKTLSQWMADNAGSTLNVVGMSIGVGSGWSGAFNGAVDNVKVDFAGGPSVSSNFEVNAAVAAVPEPATWAFMMMGVGLMGVTLRQRKRQALA